MTETTTKTTQAADKFERDDATLREAATMLRDIHQDITTLDAVGDIIKRRWDGVINAEGSRHVAYKADFLQHYILDLVWGIEREIEHWQDRAGGPPTEDQPFTEGATEPKTEPRTVALAEADHRA